MLEKLQSASVCFSAVTLAGITTAWAQYPAYFRYSKPSFMPRGTAFYQSRILSENLTFVIVKL